MADKNAPDTLHLATLRYVDKRVSCPVIVCFPFALTEANLEAANRRKSIEGVVTAAGDSDPVSVDGGHGYYWSDPAKWILPKAHAQKIVFAGPWWLLSMQMIDEARNAGVRAIVHRSLGRWWDTPLALLVGMKLARRVFWELWHVSHRIRQATRWLVLTAARVELFRRVAKRLARPPWAKRGLHVLETWARPGAVATAEIFREAIAGTEKAPGFVPGRVVLVCGSLAPGGAERQVVNTLLGLRRYELESVRLLCDYLMPNHPEKYDFYLPRLREAGIEAREIPARKTGWFSRHGSVPKALARNATSLPPRLVHDISNLYWEFRELKPEVVHAWLDWSNVRAGVAAAMAGVPRVILAGQSINPTNFSFYQYYMDPVYTALAELANVVLVNNSRAGAADYARWLNLPESRFRILYNGVHLGNHRRASDEAIAAFRARLGIPPGALVVGSVFRAYPEKRPLLWVESAAAVAARMHQDVRFVVFGEGPMRAEMIDRAKQLGIADSLLLPGLTNEVDLALSSMDVFLMTSSIEGVSNVVLEAQSVGTPVVATEAGGMREALEPGVTGWIVEKPDPQAIAERVVALFTDTAARASARQAGPAFVSHRFSLGRMIQETIRSYGYIPEDMRKRPE